MTLARKYAQVTVPMIYTRRVGMRHYDTLYAVWMEWNGTRIARCIEVPCVQSGLIGAHFIVEAELNRMLQLEDPRPEGGIT
jgi:hypothetical protein